MLRWLCLLLLLPPFHARADEAGDRAAIAAASRGFSAAYVANDGEALARAYSEDAVLLPSDREVQGRAAAAAYFAWKPGHRQLAHAMRSDLLELRGDTAIDIGRWHSRHQRDGGEAVESSGSYLVVWVREPDGIWRIKYDMWHRPRPVQAAAAQ